MITLKQYKKKQKRILKIQPVNTPIAKAPI